MTDRDFGGLIRESRERVGLTTTRVAELIGRAPGTVRSWERGRSIPSESTVVSSLAAVLGIEERMLFEAAGLDLPAEQPTVTIEQSLASIAPSQTDEGDDGDASEDIASSEESGEEAPEEEPEEEEGSERVHARARHRWRQEARLAPEQSTTPPAVQFPYQQPAPQTPPSYLEDEQQRVTYRLRNLYTAIAVAILFIVLAWALGNTVEALGEAWDAFFGGF